MVYLPAQTQFS